MGSRVQIYDADDGKRIYRKITNTYSVYVKLHSDLLQSKNTFYVPNMKVESKLHDFISSIKDDLNKKLHEIYDNCFIKFILHDEKTCTCQITEVQYEDFYLYFLEITKDKDKRNKDIKVILLNYVDKSVGAISYSQEEYYKLLLPDNISTFNRIRNGRNIAVNTYVPFIEYAKNKNRRLHSDLNKEFYVSVEQAVNRCNFNNEYYIENFTENGNGLDIFSFCRIGNIIVVYEYVVALF